MPFDPNSPNVVEGIDDEPIKRGVIIPYFGRNLNDVACFKESFLYGILGGVGLGLLTFVSTSRVRTATNVAVYSFAGIVLCYYIKCSHNRAINKFTIAQTQRTLQEIDRRISTLDQSNDNQTKD